MKIHNEIPQFTINRQKDNIYYLILLTRYTEGSYDINDLRFKLNNKNIRKFKFWATGKLADIIENG